MGKLKILGIILMLYVIAGFIVAYLLSAGTIVMYNNVMVEYTAVVFLPIIYLFDLIAPFLGLPFAYFGA